MCQRAISIVHRDHNLVLMVAVQLEVGQGDNLTHGSKNVQYRRVGIMVDGSLLPLITRVRIACTHGGA